jgi:hypothetical protein
MRCLPAADAAEAEGTLHRDKLASASEVAESGAQWGRLEAGVAVVAATASGVVGVQHKRNLFVRRLPDLEAQRGWAFKSPATEVRFFKQQPELFKICPELLLVQRLVR